MKFLKKIKARIPSDYHRISFDEKVKFTEKIRRLTVPVLIEFVELARSINSKGIKDLNTKKFQIRVDDLDKESFLRLSQFLDNYKTLTEGKESVSKHN